MLRLKYLNIFTVLCIGFVVFWEVVFVKGSDATSLTVVVPPRREECFFERVNISNVTLSVSYSVIASKGGDYDVNFQVSDISGRPMVTEFRKAVSQVSLVIKEFGDYKLCFDNTFSAFSTKTVSFEVTSDKRTNANWERYDREALQPEHQYDIKVKDIQDALKLVRIYINEVQSSQDAFRIIEARDRSLTESNFEFVNYCSAINTCLLVLVGFAQVVVMKSFFEDNKSFREIILGVFKFPVARSRY